MRLVIAVGMLGALLACTGAGTPSEPGEEPSAEAPEGGAAGGGGKAGKRKGGKGGKAGNGPVIAKLAASHVEGCGCYLAQGGDSLFESDIDGNAWINVDGTDVAFKQTSQPRTDEKVGATFEETYTAQAEGLVAKVRWVVIRVCGEGEEECESASYDTTIEVERGGKSGTAKASGACGC